VKEQLGHASIQITVDTYGHLIPGANRAAVDKLDDVPAQPTATPAQPEAVSGDERKRRKVFGMSGDPDFHQLEPATGVVEADRQPSSHGRVSAVALCNVEFTATARPGELDVTNERPAAMCGVAWIM
jgi:hypothetical protein